MKINLTKASKKDRYLVTISLVALTKANVLISSENEDLIPIDLIYGDEFVIEIDKVRTLFRVNRSGKTAVTRTLPRHLRLPNVGRSTSVEITDLYGDYIVGEW